MELTTYNWTLDPRIHSHKPFSWTQVQLVLAYHAMNALIADQNEVMLTLIRIYLAVIEKALVKIVIWENVIWKPADVLLRRIIWVDVAGVGKRELIGPYQVLEMDGSRDIKITTFPHHR